MSSPMPHKPDPIEIAVVGGGICGLTCAIMLMRAGVQVQVYEAASKFGEIGAGIGIGPNATRLLREIGLLDDILSRGDKPIKDWFQYVSGLEGHEIILEMPLPPGEEPFMVHRAGFLEAVVRHVDMDRVHFNKRCSQVTQASGSPKLTIHFHDGSSADADVVIGADGIKSAVRGAVTGQDPNESVVFSQSSCYRALIPIEAIEAAGVKTQLTLRPTCFVGPGQHIILFAVNGGKLINVVAFSPNPQIPPAMWRDHPLTEPQVVTITTEEFIGAYAGWGSDVTGLLGCVKQPSKWNVSVVWPPLQSYVRGRVVLIGDSAHAMMTHLGAGAGQGLEDAYLLAKLLSHPETTLDNVETVLSIYDEVRRPRVRRVWSDTYYSGNISDGFGEHGPTTEGLRKDLHGLWDFTWRSEVNEDVTQAEHRLQELGIYSSFGTVFTGL